jgi:lipoprotein-anchoring transpeptidase ErfK/SrfK
MRNLSRRGFLKSVGMAGMGIGLRAVDYRPSLQGGAITNWDGSPMGRILLNVMTAYAEPDWRASATSFLHWNDVVTVQEAVTGNGLYSTNATWLKTEAGYLYSSWVQPVDNQPNNPTVPVGENGAWGMVTVPMTWARGAPADDGPRRQRMFYSTVHRISGMENDYYRVSEIYGGSYWIKAGHVRFIPPEETAPLSPDVPPEDKLIVVRIGEQMLRAYEGDSEVFSARVSTGMPDTPTPAGEFRVRDKRHGQRMTGGLGAGAYNLPGIPWVCYFTASWAATHGCYWHNDYGRRHSNGCVNLPPAAAQWVFRWTTPTADYNAYSTRSNPEAGQPGTRIVVRW